MTVQIERTDRGFRLTTELLVPAPRDEVFQFFGDAFQLETITPPWLHFAVLTPGPIPMRPGTLIDYRLRLHGLPIRWQSRISEWEPPLQFVDEQVRGPYRIWHHRHTFEAQLDGTLVRDEVNYALPLGRLLQPLVARDLRQIFTFRHETLRRLLGGSALQDAAGSQA